MSLLIKPGLFVIAALALLTGCAGTSGPQETHDGLVRIPKTQFAEVYMAPGADLTGYGEYGLEKCTVAFKQNWLRDQNTSRLDLSSRVTQQDVDQIKDQLAEACDEHFRAALLRDPPYVLVDSFHDGEPVLVLKPSIINLDINAPDTMSPGRSRTYTTSTGEMTLSLDVVDGTTGQVLARIIDRRRDAQTSYLQWTNGVTNKAEAERVLRRWSDLLRRGLDTATAGQGV
jgi:hypothetical protein